MGFRFLNIPVFIQPSFWVFILLFSFAAGLSVPQMLIWASIAAFSILFHEYGHGLAAQGFGRPAEIHLIAFGGFTAYSSHGLNDKQQFLIALNGPVFSGLLIGIAHYLLKANLFDQYYVVYFLYYLMKINIFWLIINLLPLQPLDGGKMLNYLLTNWLGEEKGSKITWVVGNLAALAGSIYFFMKGYYIFGFLFLYHGIQNFKAHQARKNAPKSSPFSLYHQGVKAMQNEDLAKAKAIFGSLLKTQDTFIKNSAVESLALLLHSQKEDQKAYQLLLKTDPDSLRRGKVLLCRLAYGQKNDELIERYSREIYEIDPSFEIALLNAKAFARLKKARLAGGWLYTASQFDGAPSLELLLEDGVFESIREEEVFLDAVGNLFIKE